MKNNIYKILTIISVFLFIACEDEDKDPIPNVTNAAIVSMTVADQDVTSSETFTQPFSANVIASPKVVSYTLEATRGADTVVFGTYNSFPMNLNIDASAIATAFSIPVEDLNPNEIISFLGSTVDEDGATTTVDNFQSFFFGGDALAIRPIAYRFRIRI